MPDEIAKIGLDTKDIEGALDRISSLLEKNFARSARDADTHVNRLARSLRSMAGAARAALGAAGFGGFIAAARSIKGLNEDLSETRSHLVAGSKAAQIFDETVRGAGGTGGLDKVKAASNAVDAIKAHMKLKMADLAVGLGNMIGIPMDMFGESGVEDGNKKLQELEDQLVSARRNSFGDRESELQILQKEVELENMKVKVYERGAMADRIKLNSAKDRLGALTAQLVVLYEELSLSEDISRATRFRIEAERQGYKHLGAEQKINAEFNERVMQARVAGKPELVAQLELQRKIAIEDEKVSKKRETSAERRENRREVRIRESDLKKQAAREAEFQRLTERGIRGERGSRLFEWQNRPRAIDARPSIGNADLLVELQKIVTNTKTNLSLKTR